MLEKKSNKVGRFILCLVVMLFQSVYVLFSLKEELSQEVGHIWMRNFGHWELLPVQRIQPGSHTLSLSLGKGKERKEGKGVTSSITPDLGMNY